MNIKTLLEKRFNKEGEDYKILGAEIKHRRKSLAKTLAFVAMDTCSISYASKIENSMINPNKAYLEEICYKLDFTKNDYDNLYLLRKYLLDAIKNFYFDRDLELIDLFENIKVFKNYRCEVIKLIYFLFINDFSKSKDMCDSIDLIIETMSDTDFIVYSVFKAVYFMKTEYYIKAAEIIKEVSKYAIEIPCLKAICDEVLLESSFEVNSLNFYEYYEKFIYENMANGNMEKIEKGQILNIMYILKNKTTEHGTVALKKLIFSRKYDAFETLIEILNDNKYKIPSKKELKERDLFIYYICLGIINKKQLTVELEKEQFSFTNKQYIILNCLKYNLSDEKLFTYIADVAYPYAINAKDSFLAKKLSKIYIEFLNKKSLYKKSCSISAEVMTLMDETANV